MARRIPLGSVWVVLLRDLRAGGTIRRAMRGTLLNTATVAVGATIGVVVGRGIPASFQEVALAGLGLVTVGIGLKMFLQSKKPLIAAVAVAIGGVLGLALGIQSGIMGLAGWAQGELSMGELSMGGELGMGDQTRFVQGTLTSFVLFCIGPMTLLGCLQDALEKKIELLALKSTMDGIAAVFLAAASGAGVLLTALLLLIFQGGLTLLARPLRSFADDKEALAELTGTGGAILLATGIGLMGIKDLHPANYLPAIFLAPAISVLSRRFSRSKAVPSGG
jgi:uncharacterized protein